MNAIEKLVCSAVRTPKKIFTGKRHADCYEKIHDAGIYLPDLDFAIEGFVTTHNRFVDRFEAAKIAKASKQIPSDSSIVMLYSEDVWPE